MRRNGLLIGAGFILLVVVAVLARGVATQPENLDPESTARSGTRALVELVDAYGMQVEVGGPGLLADVDDIDAEATTILVLRDVGSSAAGDELRDLASMGATIVSVDQYDWVLDRQISLESTGDSPRGQCSIIELDDVMTIERARHYQYVTQPGDQSCFGTDSEAAVLRHFEGLGSITLIAGPSPLTNEYLGEEDNAVLAVRLLNPRPDTTLYILYDYELSTFGDGEPRTLTDLVSTPVRWFIFQLLAASLIVVLWRARRFGGVVAEPQLVKVPASRIVLAAGEIRRRGAKHAKATERIIDDFRRQLQRYYHLRADLSDGEIAAAVSGGNQALADEVLRVLNTGPVLDDRALVETIRAVDALAATLMLQPSEHFETKERTSS